MKEENSTMGLRNGQKALLLSSTRSLVLYGDREVEEGNGGGFSLDDGTSR